MDVLTVLQQRVSVTKLAAPPPDHAVLTQVFKAAVRAADHGKLQPWRFLVIEGEGLVQLSHLFVAAALKANPDVSQAVVEKCRNMPGRAPMIIVSIAKYQPSSKVPQQEQLLACAAATQNILNALFSLNFGAVWRTGDMAYDRFVMQALGLSDDEEIIGFVYVGTPAQEVSAPVEIDISQFFKVWPPK